MGQYEKLRSSSPSNEHRSRSSAHPATPGQIPRENRGVVDEQEERLLSAEEDEAVRAYDLNDSPRRRRSRKWRRLAFFGLASLVLVATIAILLNRHFLSEKGNEISKTFRRPSSDYVIESNWDYEASPTVREYHWVISDINANPDGVIRPMVVINGQFPGPMIVCNEGDTIVVNVVNQAKNATAIHWHGIFQNGTNFMDGTAGVTQCPIAPAHSYRYEFTVKGQVGSCECPSFFQSEHGSDADRFKIFTTGIKLLRGWMASSALWSSFRKRRSRINLYRTIQIVS